METQYFLFGSQPVRHYQDGMFYQMKKHLKNGDGVVICFDYSKTDISEFLDTVMGWEDFVPITEVEYFEYLNLK